MPAIFLSYRRSDSPDAVAHLQDRLVQRFSEKRIFRDADDLPLGVSVPTHLRQTIGDSDVVLVVIGPNWATARDEHGRRWLDDPNDVVRISVETALRSDVPVIPVLVAGAQMPGDADLPDSMRELTNRRGLAIRPSSESGSDVDQLIAGIEKLRPARSKREGVRSPKSDAITSMPISELSEVGTEDRDERALDWDRDEPSIRNNEPDVKDPNAPSWTGALGISSFAIAIVSGSSMMAMFLTAGLMVQRAGGRIDRQSTMIIGFVFLGLIAFSGLGAVLGFVGVLGRFRLKILAGVGLGLNGLMFFGSIALIVATVFFKR
jgi:hypothetical protein